jgi:uncharacterized membrane protein (DUF106 family)
MMILLLGFIVCLLVVFVASTLVIERVAKAKAELNELRAWKHEQQRIREEMRRISEAQSDYAWRRNKQMVMY